MESEIWRVNVFPPVTSNETECNVGREYDLEGLFLKDEGMMFGSTQCLHGETPNEAC